MPKLRVNYEKLTPQRVEHRNEVKSYSREQTEKRSSQEGYFETLSGERVQVELTSGRQIEGVLSASTYNRYDIVLESSEGRYLVPKAAILYVKHCEGGDIK